jgi:hypothetical protein
MHASTLPETATLKIAGYYDLNADAYSIEKAYPARKFQTSNSHPPTQGVLTLHANLNASRGAIADAVRNCNPALVFYPRFQSDLIF